MAEAVRKVRSGDRTFRLAILSIAVVATMAWAAEVLRPLALAILLSFALAPLARWLEDRGLPRVPATLLTFALALGGLGALGGVVSTQLLGMSSVLPDYQENIDAKLAALVPRRDGMLARVSGFARHVTRALEGPGSGDEVPAVRVVDEAGLLERLSAAAGPYVEVLGVGSIVLILSLFLLLHREDMSDRIIRLFGQRRIGLTTRTMDEAGRRISRYLAILLCYNSAMGAVLGLVVWSIGVPYAATWGVLGAMLRFIPYLGPAASFLLPSLYAAAHFPGWWQAIAVVAIFAAIEGIMSSFFEPIMYGRTTGISAVGLLVAAMFWTWLWGPVGLLLSTPLTVCLAAMGKYMPSLGLLATIFGEEPALTPDVRLYQRLLAVDRAEVRAVVDEQLRSRPLARVFDELFVPALARTELDHAREEIDDRDRAAVWRAFDDLLDDLEWKAGAASGRAVAGDGGGSAIGGEVLGLAAVDTADALVLRMLNLLLAPHGRGLSILPGPGPAEEAIEAAVARGPGLVVLSHMPPLGLASTRALASGLRGRRPELPVVVGLWGESAATAEDTGRLSAVGRLEVVFSVAEARDRILARVQGGAEVAGLLAGALRAGDLETAGEIFGRLLASRPHEEIFAEVVLPTLAAVEADPTGEPRRRAVEFFCRHLGPLINAVREPRPDASRAVAACPADDPRELWLMMLALTLRGRGRDVLYLGGSVPPGRIPEVLDGFRPHLVILAASDAGQGRDLAAIRPPGRRAGDDCPIFAFLGPAFAAGRTSGVGPDDAILPDDPRAAAGLVDRLVGQAEGSPPDPPGGRRAARRRPSKR